MKVLQTSALPLGYVAWEPRGALTLRRGDDGDEGVKPLRRHREASILPIRHF